MEDGVLGVLRTVLDGTVEAVGRTIADRGGFDPALGSPAAREIAEESNFASPLNDHPVQTTYSVALMRLGAGIDHIQSLVRLLEEPPNIFGSAGSARTVIETSARAWWLLDPGVDTRTRVARGLSERIANFKEQGRIPIPAIQAHSKKRLDRLVHGLASTGFVVTTNRKGIPLHVEQAAIPTAIDVIRAQLGDKGEVAYRDLSAVAHGTQHGIVTRLERVGTVAGHPDITLMKPRVDEVPIANNIGVALLALWEAFDRRFRIYGWGRSYWEAFQIEAKRTLQPIYLRDT